MLAVITLLLAVIAGIYTSSVFSQSYNALYTIGVESVPSVDAAQSMAGYIQDIDAKSADYLAAAGLTQRTTCPIPGTNYNPGAITIHQCDDQIISAELANKELYIAIHNVTYPGERTAVERITAGFEEYRSDITVMRHEYTLAASKTDPRDPHLKMAYQAYSAANSVLLQHITQPVTVDSAGHPLYDETNIPTCTINDPLGSRTLSAQAWPQGSIQDNIDCLNSINKGFLDNSYASTAPFLTSAIILTILSCLIFCLLLAFITGRLIVHTHRIMQPIVMLALVASIVFSIVVISNVLALSGSQGAFSQLVKNDYDTVYTAAQLNHYGTAANADESRWLIALEFGNQADVQHWQQDWQDNKSRVALLITTAQQNRALAGDSAPLQAMQTNWQTYTTIDGQIRAAARNTSDPNNILDGERISTGISNQAFGRFADAVAQLGRVNRNAFNTTYTFEAGNLQLYTTLALLLFPILGLLTVWGITLRFKYF